MTFTARAYSTLASHHRRLAIVLIATAFVACDDAPGEDGDADGESAPDDATSTTTGSWQCREPWSVGCGDVITCSFFFNAFPQLYGCFTERCAAEIAACGVDGTDCADAIRCGDDFIALDAETDCFDTTTIPTWWCYHDRPECAELRQENPAALELMRCITEIPDPCLDAEGCDASFPPACSALP